jgi:hypothetical protein
MLHTYTRFYRTLDLMLDGGTQRQEYPLGLAAATFRADRTLLSGLLQAQMTRSLKLTLGAALQHNRYAGEEPLSDREGVFLLPRQDDRWTVEVFYGPSPQVALTARIGRASTDSVGMTLQRYHVDWHPFPGGALRLAGLYDLDVDSIGHRQARRLTFNPVWTINRRTTLSANYSRLAIIADPPSRSTSFVTTLSLTL